MGRKAERHGHEDTAKSEDAHHPSEQPEQPEEVEEQPHIERLRAQLDAQGSVLELDEGYLERITHEAVDDLLERGVLVDDEDSGKYRLKSHDEEEEEVEDEEPEDDDEDDGGGEDDEDVGGGEDDER